MSFDDVHVEGSCSFFDLDDAVCYIRLTILFGLAGVVFIPLHLGLQVPCLGVVLSSLEAAGDVSQSALDVFAGVWGAAIVFVIASSACSVTKQVPVHWGTNLVAERSYLMLCVRKHVGVVDPVV